MFHKKLLLLLLFSFPIIYLVLQKVRRVVLLCSLYHTCLAMWITLLKQHWNTTLLLKIGCNSCSTCVMCHVCGKRRQNWIFLQNKNCHQRNILYFLFSTSVRLTWMSSHPCKYLFMRCFIYFWVQFFFFNCLNLLLMYVFKWGGSSTRDRRCVKTHRQTKEAKIRWWSSCALISGLWNRQPQDMLELGGQASRHM